MKRKELYNYVRGEIISELTETTYAGKGAVEKIKQDPKFKTLNTSAQTNAIGDLNKGGDVELEEADLDEARKAGAFKAGDKDKLATAKEIYTTGLYAKVLNAIEEAGENGLTQKELGVKLGINDTVLNPILNKFLTIGVFSGGKLAAVPKPEKPSKEEKPEVEEPETEEPVDTYYKGDEEEEAPEEEPTVDVGAEKELGTAQAQKLSPEDEDKYAKLKKGVDAKIARLKGLSAAKRAASDDMKVLKQLSSRDDVKKLFKAKGVDIKDLIADL